MILAARCFALLLAAFALAAHATIPDAFGPVVAEAARDGTVDLNPAIARARAERKPLLIYLGAHDCPYCRQYDRFTRSHQAALLAAYSRYVVVDIRTSLRAPGPFFRVGDRRYSFAEFQSVVGDRGSKRAFFPYFWLVTPELKAREIPRGSAFFRDLREHQRILGG